MSDALAATEQELNLMLDEGVRVALSAATPDDIEIRVVVEDEGCAECLVPDETLIAIAQESVGRHGGPTDATFVVSHEG